MSSNDKFLKQKAAGSRGMLSIISRVPQRSEAASNPSYHPGEELWDGLPWVQGEAKSPALHRDTRKAVGAELGVEGEEEEGGEHSLGSQGQLPVVGANPEARPAAENHVSHGPSLGRGGRGHT